MKKTRTVRSSLILLTIKDSVKDLIYYDRKEDEELPLGDIEEAYKNKEITIEDMVRVFTDSIKEYLE